MSIDKQQFNSIKDLILTLKNGSVIQLSIKNNYNNNTTIINLRFNYNKNYIIETINSFNQKKSILFNLKSFKQEIDKNYFHFLNKKAAFEKIKNNIIDSLKLYLNLKDKLLNSVNKTIKTLNENDFKNLKNYEETIEELESYLNYLNNNEIDKIPNYYKNNIIGTVKIFKNKKVIDNEEWKLKQLVFKIFNAKFKNSVFTEEFSSGHLKKRPDIVYLSLKSIDIFELKSKSDTLKRLLPQIEEYIKYGHTINIILDQKHLKNYQKNYSNHILMNYCNIYIATDNDISLLSNSTIATTINEDILTGFLWGDDLNSILYDIKYISKKNKHIKYDLFSQKYSNNSKEKIDIILKILYNRYLDRNKKNK